MRAKGGAAGGASPIGLPTGAEAIDGFFGARGWTPWDFQRRAWEAFGAGRDGLVQVATGAGKTYAAALGPLGELVDELGRGGFVRGLRVAYVTPLRAVSRDIELSLREFVEHWKLAVRVESRTGDTPASVRARQREVLPEVLVTTPESLTLLLTREDAGEVFSRLVGVVVDEWHELLASKRGTQVELALARLRRFAPRVRAWGLSATLPNVEEAASVLAGTGRSAEVVRGEMARPVTIDTVLPGAGKGLPLAGHMGLSMLEEVVAELDPGVSTLVFTNTRSQAERWFHAILVARPGWEGVMALHHGSIDRGERERVERGLKSGEIRIVVATSSLDLGVDFAPVERVFQVGSPKGVARLVQRAGRSAHRPRVPCRVTCVPTHGMELIEIAAAREALSRGLVEARRALDKPLDVLVQHLVTCALGGGFEREEMLAEVRSAWSYRGLTEEEFSWCLELVSRGGATLGAYPEFHRVREEGGRWRVPSARHAQLHRMNVGTITGDGTVEIRYRSGRSLGRIEEGFVAGLDEGQKFVFAGKVVALDSFRDLVAYVRPASGRTTYTPIWSGTKLPISESLSEAIRTTLERTAAGDAELMERAEVRAAREIVRIQERESAVVGAEETLAEILRTREGHHLFLFPFEGRLVHAGLAAVLGLRLSRRRGATFSMAVNDYGLEILSDREYPFAEGLDAELFTLEGLAEDAMASAGAHHLARLQFREVARVAGLVVGTQAGRARTARQLQASSSLIFDVFQEFDPGNLLLEQARREVMQRHFERGRLARTMERLARGKIRVVETRRATPLSFPLIIERLAGRESSRSILERVEEMRAQWDGNEAGRNGEVVVRGRGMRRSSTRRGGMPS